MKKNIKTKSFGYPKIGENRELKFDLEKYTYTPTSKNRDGIPVWFCFPCTYMIGMSSLGYLSLFKELDTNNDVIPEKIFTDTEKTLIMPKNVELAGFSFSFEFDYLGVFKILEKYKIPFRSKDRIDEPLIFGGGPVLTANPEPFADFFDFIIIGDGENVLNEIVEVYKGVRFSSRDEKLLKLSQIQGIYVPSLHKEDCIIEKRVTKNFNDCVYSPIVTEKSFFKNTFLIETARGCPRKCRFCLASYLNLPARYPDVENIKSAIDLGLTVTNKIGLLGALIADHSCFEDICSYILNKRQEKEFEMSVSSLRADKISELAVKTLVACGQKHATIAVEAGNERLKKIINKNLNETQIRESVAIANKNGLKGLKIYGMIGLPTEETEDIIALINLMKILKTENKGFDLTLSVSSFVPKANTPFQWAGREDSKSLKKKNELLKKELAIAGIKYKPTSTRWDYIQAVISRGDRSLSCLIEETYKHNGSCESFTKSGLYLDWYATRNIALTEKLPWEFINTGVSRETLENEYKKAVKEDVCISHH